MANPISRAELLGSTSFRPSKLVEVAGHTFRIVGLSSGELRRGEDAAKAADDEGAAVSARLRAFLRYGLVDEDLQPLLQTMEEVELLEDKIHQGALLALCNAIGDLTLEDADPGKAGPPSSPSPASSPPTTSPSSSGGSPASSATSPPPSSP